jgi:hypothetical protein
VGVGSKVGVGSNVRVGVALGEAVPVEVGVSVADGEGEGVPERISAVFLAGWQAWRSREEPQVAPSLRNVLLFILSLY